jgi:hypothetical protein
MQKCRERLGAPTLPARSVAARPASQARIAPSPLHSPRRRRNRRRLSRLPQT